MKLDTPEGAAPITLKGCEHWYTGRGESTQSCHLHGPDVYAKIKDEIAQAAREKVLDDLRKCYVQAFDDPNVNDIQKMTFEMVDAWIESLRHNKEQP
jgi:hypothetical protein